MAVERLLHSHRTARGVTCRTEHHHQPVAEVLHLGARRLTYRLPQEREVRLTERLSLTFTKAGQRVGGLHQVRKEHRDDAGRAHCPLRSARDGIGRDVQEDGQTRSQQAARPGAEALMAPSLRGTLALELPRLESANLTQGFSSG